MTSLERLLEYTELPQEPPLCGEAGALAPPPGWPHSGEITFEKVAMGDARELSSVRAPYHD